MSMRITMGRSAWVRAIAVIGVCWLASLDFTAHAADLTHRSRSIDKSAERALERAQQAALAASAASAAAAASAASAAACAASDPGCVKPEVLPLGAPKKATAPPPPPSALAEKSDVALTVGGAYKGNDHASTWTTPFMLTADRGNWHVELNGDGYTHQRGATPGQGLADLSVLGSYVVVITTTLSASPTLQWTFPTGGAVGSQRMSQEASILFKKQVAKLWYVSLEPVVDRDTEDPARTARFGKSLRGKLTWKNSEHLDTFFQVVLDQPAGARHKTKLLVEHDFPIVESLDGSLILARSLAGAYSANNAEFDLTWSF